MTTPDTDTPARAQAALTPETRELLAELYGAWWKYATSGEDRIPFLGWLEYIAGNCWLDERKDAPPPAPVAGREEG